EASETNDSVVFFAFGKGAGRRGNFKSARHADNFDFLLLGATLHQPVEGALQQSIGNKSVESGHHDRKALASGVQLPLDRLDPLFTLRFQSFNSPRTKKARCPHLGGRATL